MGLLAAVGTVPEEQDREPQPERLEKAPIPSMPEEAAAKLLTEGERVRSRGSGVGLLNVHNRIRLRFGEQYGLQIESFPDEGMTVRIHIPYIPYTEETCRQLEERKLPDGKGGRSV